MKKTYLYINTYFSFCLMRAFVSHTSYVQTVCLEATQLNPSATTLVPIPPKRESPCEPAWSSASASPQGPWKRNTLQLTSTRNSMEPCGAFWSQRRVRRVSARVSPALQSTSLGREGSLPRRGDFERAWRLLRLMATMTRERLIAVSTRRRMPTCVYGYLLCVLTCVRVYSDSACLVLILCDHWTHTYNQPGHTM